MKLRSKVIVRSHWVDERLVHVDLEKQIKKIPLDTWMIGGPLYRAGIFGSWVKCLLGRECERAQKPEVSRLRVEGPNRETAVENWPYFFLFHREKEHKIISQSEQENVHRMKYCSFNRRRQAGPVFAVKLEDQSTVHEGTW